VFLSLTAGQPWEGRLVFDRPRHKLLMHLPLDYTRINQFPEWFTVQAGDRYTLTRGGGEGVEKTGAQFAEGLPLKLRAGEALFLEVH